MKDMKVLQVISGNDVGGGGNYVLNLSFYSKDKFQSIIGTIGGGGLYDKSKSMNIDTVKFKRAVTYDRYLIDYVRENHIDLVNFHGAKAFFMHYFLKNKIDVPTVATVHSDYRRDFLNNRIKYLFFTPLSALGLGSFKQYICVSDYIKSLLGNQKFIGEKFVVNSGMDFNSRVIKESRESIRARYNILENDFVYVNVARCHPIKNQLSLIEAFNMLKKQIKDAKLMIVGDGPMEETLRQKVAQLHLENRVIFTGYKPNALDFANAGEVGILTSFSEGGAPPMTLLESAAVKKYFIAPDVGDIGKVLGDNLISLINPNSVEDIYKKMREIYEERNEIYLKGEKLYDAVVDKFSIDSFCTKYYNAYTKILSEK
ncbi:glycosyltransferase [Clostridium autoethanogenum]|uniref:Glycosyltransferase n=5 Tax=Clostridium TaxID=1485 RepID=A0A3M0S4P7_9CLOT|nr:glycosyltransferase [Clostridium autoethanogenum]